MADEFGVIVKPDIFPRGGLGRLVLCVKPHMAEVPTRTSAGFAGFP